VLVEYIASRKDFLLHLVIFVFQTIFRHSKQMSYAAALCSFARYEPWTKKVIVLAGRGREQVCQIVRGQLKKRGQDVC
jgi:hypothetical protein